MDMDKNAIIFMPYITSLLKLKLKLSCPNTEIPYRTTYVLFTFFKHLNLNGGKTHFCEYLTFFIISEGVVLE